MDLLGSDLLLAGALIGLSAREIRFMQNWMATDGRFSTWEDRIYKPVESLTVVLHIQLSAPLPIASSFRF